MSTLASIRQLVEVELSISQASISDLDIVRSIDSVAFAMSDCWAIDLWKGMLKSSGTKVYIGRHSTSPPAVVGFVVFERGGKIMKLAVLPELQHCGYGGQLLDSALAAFRPDGEWRRGSGVTLHVDPRNAAALALYTRRGFRVDCVEATHDSLSGGLPPPVTSRGCCRAYICFVLYRALLYVQLLRRHDYAVFFPFPVHFIEQWLLLAQFDCANNVRYQELLGGTLLQANDPSTFWTIPQQFFTWWKNNIERKTKFRSLSKDGRYVGEDEKHRQRALYCRVSLAVASNVKCHFERIVKRSRGQVTAVEVPFESALANTVRATSLGDDATAILAFMQQQCGGGKAQQQGYWHGAQSSGAPLRAPSTTSGDVAAPASVAALKAMVASTTLPARHSFSLDDCSDGDFHCDGEGNSIDSYFDPTAVVASAVSTINAPATVSDPGCSTDSCPGSSCDYHTDPSAGSGSGYPNVLVKEGLRVLYDSAPSAFDQPSTNCQDSDQYSVCSSKRARLSMDYDPGTGDGASGGSAGEMFMAQWKGHRTSFPSRRRGGAEGSSGFAAAFTPVKRKSSTAVLTKFPSALNANATQHRYESSPFPPAPPPPPHRAHSAQYDSFSPAANVAPGSGRAFLSSPDTVTGFDHGEDGGVYGHFVDADGGLDPYVAQGGAIITPLTHSRRETGVGVGVGFGVGGLHIDVGCVEEQYCADNLITSPSADCLCPSSEASLDFELFCPEQESSPTLFDQTGVGSGTGGPHADEDCMSTENCEESETEPGNRNRNRSRSARVRASGSVVAVTGEPASFQGKCNIEVPPNAEADAWLSLLCDIVKLDD